MDLKLVVNKPWFIVADWFGTHNFCHHIILILFNFKSHLSLRVGHVMMLPIPSNLIWATSASNMKTKWARSFKLPGQSPGPFELTTLFCTSEWRGYYFSKNFAIIPHCFFRSKTFGMCINYWTFKKVTILNSQKTPMNPGDKNSPLTLFADKISLQSK